MNRFLPRINLLIKEKASHWTCQKAWQPCSTMLCPQAKTFMRPSKVLIDYDNCVSAVCYFSKKGVTVDF